MPAIHSTLQVVAALHNAQPASGHTRDCVASRVLLHANRITSAKAEMLIICTPGGNEGLYRYVGRDRATQRPDGWAITPERLAEGAKMVGNVVLGPPR